MTMHSRQHQLEGTTRGAAVTRRGAGWGDKAVRLWNATTGAARGTLESHSGSVYPVVFPPDGQLVAPAPEHTDEHEQPSGSAESSGQIPGGERDASTSTRAEGDGAGQRVSFP